MHPLLTLLAFVANQANAVPCAAHVEDQRILLADPLAFEPRTAELTPESAGPVQGIACLLEEQPDLTVQIEVHTDTRGSSAYNLRITQERADAIRAALLDKGIAPERATAVGYGETYPVEAEDWAESLALSRRIELYTAPPESRPPRPEQPQPAPVPERVVVTPPPPSLCDSLSGISATVPDLPGARSCQTVELGWICRFGESSATLSGRVQACVGGERDGDELYVSVDGGRLAVTPDREGASGSLLRYEPVP